MRELLKNIVSKLSSHESKVEVLEQTVAMQDREYDLVRTELCKRNSQVMRLEAENEQLKKENATLLEQKNKYLSQVKQMILEKKVSNEE